MKLTVASGVALLIFSALISAFSQVLLKKSAMKTYASPIREYLNPRVIGAYAIFFAAMMMTLLSYRAVDVSLGTLLETTGYIFIFIFDVLIFHQKITWKKITGTLLIIAGVACAVFF